MEILLAMSIFYIGYGILGLFGKMNIPEKLQNQEWTKNYIREMAVANILLGIPWLILYFVFGQYDPGYVMMFLLIILLALPSLVNIIRIERKYNNLSKKN